VLLEDILIQSGVDYQAVRGNPDDVLMECPFCTGSTDTSGSRKVFGLNLANGKAHCYRCDWKSRSVVFTARELCRVWNIDFSWRLRLSATESDVEVSESRVEKPVYVPAGLPPEYEPFSGSDDEIELKALGYLRSRGISQD